MRTIAATLVALSLIAGAAQASPVDRYFTDLGQTAPRSVFDDLNDSAPRSVFDSLRDSAPRSPFDALNDTAPRTSGDGGAGLDLDGE